MTWWKWLVYFLGCCCSPHTVGIGAPPLRKTKTIFYVGPTLYGNMPKPLKNELWLPPAAAGDILRDVSTLYPRMIVLLDGVFHQSLAVWHKEIVYALLEGAIVIGAASMGALRAADLHRYGALGVGRVFELDRDGEE